jgi:hypothetical protein
MEPPGDHGLGAGAAKTSVIKETALDLGRNEALKAGMGLI